jgi:hypothetical protein
MSRTGGNGAARGLAIGLADPESGLTMRQVRVLDALVLGSTPARAAISCRVSRTIIYEWLRQEPFRDALQIRRQHLAVAMAGRVHELGDAAIGALLAFLRREDKCQLEGVLPPHVRLAERLLGTMGLLAGAAPADRD